MQRIAQTPQKPIIMHSRHLCCTSYCLPPLLHSTNVYLLAHAQKQLASAAVNQQCVAMLLQMVCSI